MRIGSLRLRPYGAFADRTVHFGPQLTLVVGVNEAGKSTTLDGLCDLLWGVPVQTPQAFLYGRPALRLESTLLLADGTELDVVRRSTGLFDAATGAEVDCAWRTDEDSRVRWRRSFGLSHAELREGGRALCEGDGDLAQLVFAARTGQGVHRLLDRLNAEANELYKDHKGNRSVTVRLANTDYERSRSQVTEASAMAHLVRASDRALTEATADLRQAQRRAALAEQELAARSARLRAVAHARELHDIDARVAAIRAAGPVLTEPSLTDWRSATEQYRVIGDRLARLRSDLTDLHAERDAIAVDRALLADADEIRDLHLACQARLADGDTAQELAARADEGNRTAAELVLSLTGPGDRRPVTEVLESLHVPVDLSTQLDRLADELTRTARDAEQAAERFDTAHRALVVAEEATSDLDESGVDAVRAVCAAIEATIASADRQRDEIAAVARRRDDHLHRAGLPGGPVPAGLLPSSNDVRAAMDLISARRQEHQALQHQLLTVQTRLGNLRDQLRHAEADDVPTVDERDAARRERDAAVARLVHAWLAGLPAGSASDLPGAVERTIRTADGVTDRLFAGVETAARRASLAHEVTLAEAESAAVTAKVRAAVADVEDAERRWAALWQDWGRPPGPDDAVVFRQHIADARAAEADLVAATAVADDLRARLERRRVALAAALASPAADVDSLVTAAHRLIAASDEARGARAVAEAARKQVDRARRDRVEAERRHDETVTRWRTLARSCGLPEHVDHEGWPSRRRVVLDASAALRDAADVGARSVAAQRAYQAFVTRVRSLAETHGVPIGDDTGRMMAALADRREDMLDADRTAAHLADRIDRVVAEVDAGEYDLASAVARLDKLRVELAIADLTELDAAAARGRQLVDLTGELTRLTELVAIAVPGVDVPTLVRELAAVDPDDLAASVAEADQALSEAHRLLERARDHRAHVNGEHTALIGRTGAAQAHAQAQERLAVLEERAERYLVAHIQRTVLERELAEYERQHASPLLAAAGTLVEELTEGRYVGLRAAHHGDTRSLVVVTADEELRTPAELSEGTADQVFLALRLAGVAALQQERRAAGVPTLPVVLDDVLMTFDDDRAAAALRVMSRLAEDWQVIVLSHHVHLAAVAESLAAPLTVSHLSRPDAVRPTRAPDAIRATTDAPAPPRTAAPGEIRAWARRNGYALGDRGRIPTTVLHAYHQATP